MKTADRKVERALEEIGRLLEKVSIGLARRLSCVWLRSNAMRINSAEMSSDWTQLEPSETIGLRYQDESSDKASE